MTVTKEEINQYLSDLRESGEINMWGAGAYLEREFGMKRAEAKEALLEWILNFKG